MAVLRLCRLARCVLWACGLLLAMRRMLCGESLLQSLLAKLLLGLKMLMMSAWLTWAALLQQVLSLACWLSGSWDLLLMAWMQGLP
jgi:hypothetical protein